jgi:uncharacterized protein (TIGR02147 family)
MNLEEPSIYNYIDCAEFISAWFDFQRKYKYGFSFRFFSRQANMPSPNYLQRVITRQRKLSIKYLPHIITALNLDEFEAQYLTLLVSIEKSKDDALREKLTTQLVLLQSERNVGKLTKPMLQYLLHWFYPIIRELITIHQTVNAKVLSKLIEPFVGVKKIETCVEFLMINEYVIFNDQKYLHGTPILTTGDEVVSSIVNHFHRENLILSSEGLTDFPLEERDVSSLVLSLSANTFDRVKTEIQLFRKKLLQISEEEKDNVDRVYHVGFQLLPRSQRHSRRG